MVGEDSADDLFFLTRDLQTAGVENPVVIAEDGEEVIVWLEKALEEGALLPCIILLDVKMPRKDGFQALAWIQAEPRLRDIPVAMLTSSNQPKDVRQAYELGASTYLTKPIDSQLLGVIVHKARSLVPGWDKSAPHFPGLRE